ncbi:protein of unknown function DUF938 [Stanieria cyanosphaera PCC 7437]|uniref:SAM-dependent methyltransferase n=1 Tax=Stanieria cyanosphaera (strain ATCC 29371 / PCC 7437) TaxID=111780 RepID=K9XXX4_STAC7|nr:DUF938 domain-containing protein [Stanieria cyanosphaera]AFZ36507.1 protein of unknown function DUF938 [Stanieria cyanosphaera PCC 7437]
MDARQYAPATQRNREPILAVLSRVLPPQGNILELASGTGEHSVFFAPFFAPRQWYPSDPNPFLRDSIEAWRNYHSIDNLHSPFDIDVCESKWQIEEQGIAVQAIVNINMIHISPWQACLGLMSGAGRILPMDGILYLYGPYKQKGEHTAESNRSFDESLRRQNPEWGVRNLEDVARIAKSEGLELQEVVTMPANNLSVIFKKSQVKI